MTTTKNTELNTNVGKFEITFESISSILSYLTFSKISSSSNETMTKFEKVSVTVIPNLGQRIS